MLPTLRYDADFPGLSSKRCRALGAACEGEEPPQDAYSEAPLRNKSVSEADANAGRPVGFGNLMFPEVLSRSAHEQQTPMRQFYTGA